MKIHIFAEDRRKKKRSRKRKKSSSVIGAIRWAMRWSRNLVFIFVALSLLITLALRWVDPPYTSFMLVQRISTDFVPYKINWVPELGNA